MGRLRGYHLLFGVALLALIALGVWWTVYIMRSVELERKASLNELTHSTVVYALLLGHRDRAPLPGPLEGPYPLEVISTKQRGQGDLFAPAVPRHPQWGVRALPDVVRGIEERVARRRLMLVGEGSLLFVLLAICTVMLFRLVGQERRHMRRMEDVVSSVTHEMKTPLAGIKSMLQTFVAGRVPPDQQGRLYAMGLKEAERLEHMVENVLISGRLRVESYQVHLESLSLRPQVERFLEHRRRVLVDRPEAIELSWEVEPEAVVTVDPDALRVVLENLTDNAFKYGGSEPRVMLRVQGGEGRVLVAVEDGGVGFDPKRAEELFVPFRRALKRGEVQHGTGLGLTIARALARRMGGDIEASSPGPGLGSRFVVTLREARP